MSRIEIFFSRRISSQSFASSLLFLFVLNYILLRVPYKEYLNTFEQGVEAGRVSNLSPFLSQNIQDLVFLLSLMVTLFLIEYTNVSSSKFVRILKKLTNPYFLVTIVVLMPSYLAFVIPEKISRYFLGIFSIGHLEPNFGDLRGVISGISNVKRVGDQIPCLHGECVPTTWIYGRVLLLLPSFELTNLSISLVAMLASYSLIALLNGFLNKRETWIVGMFFLTPPLVLLIERQNIEVFIAILILLSVQYYYKQKFLLSLMLVVITSLIKFFPIILFIFFLTKNVPKRIRQLSVLASVGTFVYVIPDVHALQGKVTPGLSATFGLRNLWPWLMNREFIYVHPLVSITSIVLFTLTLILIFGYAFYSTKVTLSQASSIHIYLYTFGAALFLVSWLTNSNYSYRLIFLVIALISMCTMNVSQFLTKVSCTAFFVFASPLSTALALQRNLSMAILAAIQLGVLSSCFRNSHAFRVTRKNGM